MWDKNWERIRPLEFDGSITAYEFLCKILNQISTVQDELQTEIDNIVIKGGGITEDERTKLDSLTTNGIAWANEINGFANEIGDAESLVARVSYVIKKYNEIKATLESTIDSKIETAKTEISTETQTKIEEAQTETESKIDSKISTVTNGKLLPAVTASDNGKIAKVINGIWGLGNDQSGGTGGDSKWTDEAVEKLKTVFENLVYITDATGQNAVDELIQILTGTVPVTLTGISGSYINSGTLYVGDSISKDMFKVTGNYSDGSTAEISDFTFSPETATSTSNSITISYNGKTAAVTVPATAVEITSISASYNGATLYTGNTITSSMFTVTAKYNNGSSTPVSDFTFTPTKADTTPNTYVTISYAGKTTTVSVPVSNVEANGIAINSFTLNSGVTRIYPNEKIVEKGTFNYTVSYTDGTSQTVSGNSGITVSPESYNSAGEIPFTIQLISNTSVETSYDITISANPYISKITATYAEGTTLNSGTSIDINKCVVAHISQYGDTMTSGYTKDYLGTSTGLEISTYTIVEGTQTIYVYCLTEDARTLSTTFTITGKAVSSDYTISYDTKLTAGENSYQQIDTSDAPTLASGETTVSLESSFSKLANSMPNQYFTNSVSAHYLNSSWTSEKTPYIVTTGGATTSGSGSVTFTPTANVIVHAIPIVFLYGVSGYTSDSAAVASYNYAPVNMMKNSTTHLSSWSTLLTNIWAIGNRTYTVSFGASAASYSLRIQFWKYDESNSVFQYAGEWKQSKKTAETKTATFDANLSIPDGFTIYPSGTTAIDADYFSLCVGSVGGDTTDTYETVSGDLSITFTEG